MSILAEPRRKQRLSVDPQNLQWKDDKQKLSRRLMERMGWSEGDGLGRNRQGQAGQLKLKANYSGKGLGADKLSSYDSTWIGHHEDFADILNYLNKLKEQDSVEDEQKEEQVKKISLELNSKNLRRRIHYQKFVRSKDVSNYSPNDRFAIIGMGLSRIKPGDSEKMEPSKKTERRSDGVYSSDSKTTVSTLSVNEYFAVKMAALKARTEQTVNETKVDLLVLFCISVQFPKNFHSQ
uniref:G-patch domain-containing protein n=1 Tax=Angiostrongylus cantonensis TaxID=6313 RepID=A0A0K0DHM8_ANGCA